MGTIETGLESGGLNYVIKESGAAISKVMDFKDTKTIEADENCRFFVRRSIS